MSSTTRLLVLGVVKLFQPVHGYEVRRELISWRAQEWASVQPGSIYNALKTLTRDGLLEVASTDQVGGRPERTTYRLTSAGQEEFHTLLREEWWAVRPPIDPLMAAVSFLNEVSRAEAIEALKHRAAQVHGMVRAVEFAIENHDGRESPYHVREMMRLMNARVSAELDWSRQFVERLRRGEYATADDPPWQPPAHTRRTGPSNARLADRTRPGDPRRNSARAGRPPRSDAHLLERDASPTGPARRERSGDRARKPARRADVIAASAPQPDSRRPPRRNDGIPASAPQHDSRGKPRRNDGPSTSAPRRDSGSEPRRGNGVADRRRSSSAGQGEPPRNRPGRRIRSRGPRRSSAR